MNNFNEKTIFIKKISVFTGVDNFLKEGNIYNIFINNVNDNDKGKTVKVRLKFLRGVYAMFEDLNFKSIRYYLRYSDYHLDCKGNDDVCYSESIINSLKKTEFWSIEEVFDTYQNNIYHKCLFNETTEEDSSKKKTEAKGIFNKSDNDYKKNEIDNIISSMKKRYKINNEEIKNEKNENNKEESIIKKNNNDSSNNKEFTDNIKEIFQSVLGDDINIKIIDKNASSNSNNKKTEINKNNKCNSNCNSCSCKHIEKKKDSTIILNIGHYYFVEGKSILFGNNILGIGKLIDIKDNLFNGFLEFDFGSYKSIMMVKDIENIIPID